MSTIEAEKNNIVISLLRLGTFLHREGNRILADFNLNQQQFVVLRQIQLQEPISQKDICSQLLYEKSNISKIVKKLINNNLVKKTNSQEDSRLSLLTITKEGQTIIDVGMTLFNNWNGNWLKSLSKKEVLQTNKIVKRLTEL